MGDSPGMRVYEIRRALGPDPRHELSQRAFADLVNAKAEELGVDVEFDSSAITRIEKGERRLQVDWVPVFAAVDPLQRGPAWIAWGAAPGTALRVAEPSASSDPPAVPRVPAAKHPRVSAKGKGKGRKRA